MKGASLSVIGLAVLVIAAGLVFSLLPAADPTSPTAQAAQLASELRCPDCQGLSVAESQTSAAQSIRDEIAAQLAAGRSMDEVRASFVQRYGEWILLSPSGPLPWVVPLAGLLVGGGLLLVWLRGSSSAAAAASPPPQPTSDALRRIRSEAEELDA
jgi:cytochrome c-type biogenesis protein CcmH